MYCKQLIPVHKASWTEDMWKKKKNQKCSHLLTFCSNASYGLLVHVFKKKTKLLNTDLI